MIPLNFNMAETDLSDAQKVKEHLGLLNNKRDKLEAAKLQDSTEQFEAYFINVLLKEMRKSVPKYDDYLGGSRAQEIYEEMLDEKMSQELAKNKSFGLSQLVQDDLVRSEVKLPKK